MITEGQPGAAARLFIVRHGQTGGNRQRYVGWEDEPLDAIGMRQAEDVADGLAGEAIDAIYASPLSRARDTARPLAVRRDLDVAVREELKEIDYGRYQGLLKADQPIRLRHDHRFERMPGGESLDDVYRRVARVWTELSAELARGRSLVVVGHFWSNRMLVGVIQGISLDELFARIRYKPANGSIYRLDFSRGADGKPVAGSACWVSEGAAGASD